MFGHGKSDCCVCDLMYLFGKIEDIAIIFFFFFFGGGEKFIFIFD